VLSWIHTHAIGIRKWGHHQAGSRQGLPPTHCGPYGLSRELTFAARLRAREQQKAIKGLLAKVLLCVKTPVAIISFETGRLQMSNPAVDEFLGDTADALVDKLALSGLSMAPR
jgi:hypothetical protein